MAALFTHLPALRATMFNLFIESKLQRTLGLPGCARNFVIRIRLGVGVVVGVGTATPRLRNHGYHCISFVETRQMMKE